MQHTLPWSGLCWAMPGARRSTTPSPAREGVRHRPRWSPACDKDSGGQGGPEEGQGQTVNSATLSGDKRQQSHCNYLIVPPADVGAPRNGGVGGGQAGGSIFRVSPLGRGHFPPCLAWHLGAGSLECRVTVGSGASRPSELALPPRAGSFTSLGLRSGHCIGG